MPPAPLQHRWLRWLVLAVLLVQIGVPLVQLLKPRPARFGWQMYATGRAHPQIALVLPDGQTVPVTISDHLAYLRRDAYLQPAMTPHLCRRYPAALAVRYTPADAAIAPPRDDPCHAEPLR